MLRVLKKRDFIVTVKTVEIENIHCALKVYGFMDLLVFTENSHYKVQSKFKLYRSYFEIQLCNIKSLFPFKTLKLPEYFDVEMNRIFLN